MALAAGAGCPALPAGRPVRAPAKHDPSLWQPGQLLPSNPAHPRPRAAPAAGEGARAGAAPRPLRPAAYSPERRPRTGRRQRPQAGAEAQRHRQRWRVSAPKSAGQSGAGRGGRAEAGPLSPHVMPRGSAEGRRRCRHGLREGRRRPGALPAGRPCGEHPAALRGAPCGPDRAPKATWEAARPGPALLAGAGPAGGSGHPAGTRVPWDKGTGAPQCARGGPSVIELSAGRAVLGAGPAKAVITLRSPGA